MTTDSKAKSGISSKGRVFDDYEDRGTCPECLGKKVDVKGVDTVDCGGAGTIVKNVYKTRASCSVCEGARTNEYGGECFKCEGLGSVAKVGYGVTPMDIAPDGSALPTIEPCSTCMGTGLHGNAKEGHDPKKKCTTCDGTGVT